MAPSRRTPPNGAGDSGDGSFTPIRRRNAGGVSPCAGAGAAPNMDDHGLPKVETSSKVIEFPLHRRGSLADTLSGFPEREDGPDWNGSREEREMTLLVADLR